jgi:TRAP-type C4-dicarboxylate transport system substrate-binding protein
LTVGKEVKTPADLKDLGAFHLPGDAVSPMYYSKVGLKARPVALGELGTHLGKDIQVINIAPYAAEQLQLSSKVTHMTAMTTAFLIGALVVKKDKLDAMPADLKAMFLKSGKDAGEKLTKTIRLQDAEAFKRLKHAKTTYTPNEEELKQWAQSSADARKSLRGAPFNPEIFDRIVKK